MGEGERFDGDRVGRLRRGERFGADEIVGEQAPPPRSVAPPAKARSPSRWIANISLRSHSVSLGWAARSAAARSRQA